MASLARRVEAFRVEADRVFPNRRRSSDGGYVAKPGGHNVGARGLVHAYDLSQSMPGTPYWEPGFGQFDVWAHCYRIAREYVAATDAQRQARWRWLYDGGYMVWFDGRKDIIFNPKVSLSVRTNGSPKRDHFQHAHFECASTVVAENDTVPIFGAAQAPPKPVPIPPPAHVTIPEEDVEQTDLSMRLDAQGNGYVDLPGVKAVAVRSVLSIGIPDPQRAGSYAPIPRVSLTISPPPAAVARVVVEGGTPNGPASVRVVHA